MRSTVCAVIPAAGRGTRLGLNVPKLLAPIDEKASVWSILRRKLLYAVDRVHLVVAPQWVATFESLLADDPEKDRLSVSVQEEPRGMGDAVFGAYTRWACARTLLVLWGDQIHISSTTLARALGCHGGSSGHHCTIPTVMLDQPYVQYCFDTEDRLTEIRETREGSVCDRRGFSDVGTFVLSVEGLRGAWESYSQEQKAGALTGEVNFLPFLPYLARSGWQIHRMRVEDPLEARGINSLEDLRFFQELYATNRKAQSASVT